MRGLVCASILSLISRRFGTSPPGTGLTIERTRAGRCAKQVASGFASRLLHVHRSKTLNARLDGGPTPTMDQRTLGRFSSARISDASAEHAIMPIISILFVSMELVLCVPLRFISQIQWSQGIAIHVARQSRANMLWRDGETTTLAWIFCRAVGSRVRLSVDLGSALGSMRLRAGPADRKCRPSSVCLQRMSGAASHHKDGPWRNAEAPQGCPSPRTAPPRQGICSTGPEDGVMCWYEGRYSTVEI